jgi:hypothetical protein
MTMMMMMMMMATTTKMLMNGMMTTSFTQELAQQDLARTLTTIKEKVFISGVRGKCDERALVIEITLSKSAPTTFLLFFFVFYLLPTKPSRNIE